MTRPTVSLVTPSYNMARYIERTIRSVVCQDYPRIEYIVLDSCSRDGTAEILARYAPAIDVLVVEKDKGQSDAINRGLRMATGDIMGYLNADDCLAGPHTITQVVRRFADHPEADVLLGHRHFIDQNGDYALQHPMRPFCGWTLSRACFFAQEATFWRREAFQRVGNAIDDTFDFAMDYELWMRFYAGGCRFVSVPDVWGLFRWYPDQKSAALWKSKGLPEIARIYDRFLGYRLTEDEMFDVHREYLYGTYPPDYPESYEAYVKLWSATTEILKRQLRGKPLDGWVNDAVINAERVERIRWSKARAAGASAWHNWTGSPSTAAPPELLPDAFFTRPMPADGRTAA